MRFLSISRITLLLTSAGCTAFTEVGDGFGPSEMRIQGTVQYRAQTEASASHPGWLNTTVYIRATSVGGASVHYSGCPVTVRLYTHPARTGRPRWDALAVPQAACTLPLIVRQVERGEELALSALTLPREVLGDSLASGPYYVGALVRPNRDSLVLEAGAVNLRP